MADFIFYPDHSNVLHISKKAMFLSHDSCVHWSSTFPSLEGLFLCFQNLAVWWKQPSFHLVSSFEMPSSLSLIISSFWFKVGNMWLFLSLKTLRGHWRLSPNLISTLFYLREYGSPRRRERDGGMAGWWSKHMHLPIKFTVLCGYSSCHSKSYNRNNTDCSLQITINKYNKNEKVWNIGRITKMWHRNAKWTNAVEKMAPAADMLNKRLSKIFNL